MAKEIYVTEEGLKKLQEELEYLKTVRREEIKDMIKTAKSFGDLSENSEYDEAKNEQAIVEARIAELEEQLNNVHLVDASALENDVVRVGLSVKIKNADSGETEEYRIVGVTEADPFEGLISDESPIGKALLGQKVGTVVEVEIPLGIVKYKIMKISK
ncbi:MAG: transcription elongation factor GreA [Ruminococcaceae bacterium]|nr:transcription elongation factor GreA [Oscillospiraceae bacterium]